VYFVGLFLGAQVQSNGHLFYVTDYGADPTGATDNTQALLAAINDAFRVATTKHMMPGVSDLGGVQIHLEGGNYNISGPLRLPGSGGGNVVVMK
jgi:polygalacturonase